MPETSRGDPQTPTSPATASQFGETLGEPVQHSRRIEAMIERREPTADRPVETEAIVARVNSRQGVTLPKEDQSTRVPAAAAASPGAGDGLEHEVGRPVVDADQFVAGRGVGLARLGALEEEVGLRRSTGGDVGLAVTDVDEVLVTRAIVRDDGVEQAGAGQHAKRQVDFEQPVGIDVLGVRVRLAGRVERGIAGDLVIEGDAEPLDRLGI